MNKSQNILSIAVLLLGAGLPGVLSATTIYTVSADTSSIAGTSGYLDLQFEPGPTAVNLATVSVTAFTTTGTLTGAATLTGDVTGQLPGTVGFDNQTVFNDYFQATDFGTSETFSVTFNGPTPLGGGPTAFNIGFYAADGTTPLLTNSPDGEAGQITLNGDGSFTVTTFNTLTGGPPVLTIETPVLTTPEPAGLGLITAPLIGCLLLFRRRTLLRNSAQ